ncbi:unnamed protein product [Urochloa humidicola]
MKRRHIPQPPLAAAGRWTGRTFVLDLRAELDDRRDLLRGVDLSAPLPLLETGGTQAPWWIWLLPRRCSRSVGAGSMAGFGCSPAAARDWRVQAPWPDLAASPSLLEAGRGFRESKPRWKRERTTGATPRNRHRLLLRGVWIGFGSRQAMGVWEMRRFRCFAGGNNAQPPRSMTA